MPRILRAEPRLAASRTEQAFATLTASATERPEPQRENDRKLIPEPNWTIPNVLRLAPNFTLLLKDIVDPKQTVFSTLSLLPMLTCERREQVLPKQMLSRTLH
jgi:hypothetical protein